MWELLEGEPAQPGEGLAYPSKWKYPLFLQGKWGNISRGFCLYLWFYLFILKDLVRPNPLTPARELFLCFTLENLWQQYLGWNWAHSGN